MAPAPELWAAAKYVGRDCAELSRAFVRCKGAASSSRSSCRAEGALVSKCADSVVKSLQNEFPVLFTDVVKCLELNDLRYSDCRVPEQLLELNWNARHQSPTP